MTLKMNSAQVVEPPVNVISNSPFQDYTHPDYRASLNYDIYCVTSLAILYFFATVLHCLTSFSTSFKLLEIWTRPKFLRSSAIVSSGVWSPGGRFSKDPVTYRARKAILETIIHLPVKAALLICFRYKERQNNCHVSKLETCSY